MGPDFIELNKEKLSSDTVLSVKLRGQNQLDTPAGHFMVSLLDETAPKYDSHYCNDHVTENS